MSIENLKVQISEFPKSPGVYLFYNKNDQVLYVGKAKSLRERVRNYIGRGDDRGPRIEKLKEETVSIQYIVTNDELKALGLENNLIKRYKPKYNALLRDDKTFPYILITTGDTFPRAFVVRKVNNDCHSYFGPIIPGGRARHLLKIMHDSFNLRQCKGSMEGKKADSCLYFQMGKCRGPCSGVISKREYGASVQDAVDFLRGKGKELVKDMKLRMKEAAKKEDFEKAAYYRDLILSVKTLSPFIQRLATSKRENFDVIGIAMEEDSALCQLFVMRVGEIRNQKRLFIDNILHIPLSEVLRRIIVQYYGYAEDIPHAIIVPQLPEDYEVTAQWLSGKRGKRVRFIVPERGEKKKILKMATKNARYGFKQSVERERRNNIVDYELLGLNEAPYRIDAFDISTIQGTDSVASMVVWLNGSLCNSQYRKFEIKGFQKHDDPASIAQVVERRYGRAIREGLEFPDLVLVDGGITQVNAAWAVLKKLNLHHLPVVGLAKKEELLYLPEKKEPLRLNRDSSLLQLLQRLRDEAHRFAISYHRRKRANKTVISELENIPGIGKITAKRLLKTFGSVKQIAMADEEILARLTNRVSARNIKDYFGK